MGIRIVFAFLFTLALAGGNCFGADDLNAVILVRQNYQQTALGKSFSKALPQLIAKLISKGTPVWQDPYQSRQYTAFELQRLQEMNGVSIAQAKDIFIYEKWQVGKVAIATTPLGFRLVALAADSSLVDFGFVDARDVLAAAQLQEVESNADGNSNVTLYDLLLSHEMIFEPIQIGSETYKTEEQKQKAKRNSIGTRKFNPQTGAGTRQKEFYLELQTGTADTSFNGAVILQAFNHILPITPRSC